MWRSSLNHPAAVARYALAALSPFVLVACAGGEPSPAVPPPTTAPAGSASGSVLVSSSSPSDSGAPADAAPAVANVPPPSAAALAAVLTVDAAQVAAIAKAAAAAAAPKMQTATAEKDSAKGLAGVAAKMAPGMKPEGIDRHRNVEGGGPPRVDALAGAWQVLLDRRLLAGWRDC